MTPKEIGKKGVTVRRVGLLVAMTLALMLAFSAVAYAAFFEGTNGDDPCIIGTDGNDTMVLFRGDDCAEGRGNADTILGGSGNDELRGNDGTDTLQGDPGNDEIFGGAGEDELVGNRGDDTIVAGDDKQPDEVQCGKGVDTVFVSGPDNQAGSLSRSKCENIVPFHEK